MPRFLRILVTGSAFFVYSALGAFIGYVLLPATRLLGGTEVEKIARCQTVLHRCCRFFVGYMRVLGILSLSKPKVPEVLKRREACVVIANHPSLLDVIMMVASVKGLVFLAKRSWFKSPFIAPLLKHGGHIPGPPEDVEELTPMDGALVLERMLERIREGFPVLIFPEGTRSPAGELRQYQRGAFEAAMRAQVPLVAFTYRVEPPSLLKDQRWYEVPDRRIEYHLELLFERRPEEFPRTARIFRREVQAQYEQALGIEPKRELQPAAPAEPASPSRNPGDSDPAAPHAHSAAV